MANKHTQNKALQGKKKSFPCIKDCLLRQAKQSITNNIIATTTSTHKRRI